MKRVDVVKKFREMSEDGLKEKIVDLEAELMNLRFRHASGQLEQTAQLRTISRNIARAKMFLRDKVQANAEG
jgi:large subunit ribosomal protein L29